MSMYVLAGAGFNVIEDGTFTPTPAADSLFPPSNLADGDPSSIFKFGSVTAAPQVVVDIDALRGTGGGETFTGGAPGSPTTLQWVVATTGTGTVTQASGIGLVHSGTFSIACTAGTGTASAYVDVTVRAGAVYNIEAWSRTTTGGLAIIRVRNQHTGSWLDNAGSWTQSPSNWGGTNGTTFAVSTNQITIEDVATCQRTEVTLRILVTEEVATEISYFDDIILIPVVDFVSIHGHNIDQRSTLSIKGSVDNFATTTVTVALTVRAGSFWGSLGASYGLRYWKLLFTETNTSAIWIGEWVLGLKYTLATGPSYSMSMGHSDPRVSVPKRVGAPAVYQLSQFTQRTLPITFRAESMTRRLEILREVFERSRGGRPLVVVPHHTDSFTEVIYGRLAADLPHTWETKAYVVMETTVEELALPMVTS